ncbi:hypothetical protein BXT84_02625 [Sulfobacillus thermotolerans]|uniref:Major facilitator superfamily (MFS) profile domain-containing protein n=1 Tax=Sulfobacillus thermotolerans TaxID=338644 RepID=A0ABM6RNU0_9FIRM|nr:hypothetical protein BXT84_02625 [Sulfobacillus thermotolerans]
MAFNRTLAEGINHMPLGRQHYRIWITAAAGFLFEGLDLTIAGGILIALIKAFHLNNTYAGVIGSTALAGYVVGVAIAGWLGDKFGRKFVISYTLLVFTLLTLLSALSWNGIIFGILRFLVGIGVGGESAIVTPYLAEIIPARVRGRLLGLSDAMFTVGAIIASVVNLVVIPAGPWGWRLALVIAGLPAAYVWVIRRNLPESPQWLANHHQLEEAEAVIRQLAPINETSDLDPPIGHPVSSASFKTTEHPSNNLYTLLWSTPYARITAALWIVWFFIELVYYGFLVWLPELLVKHGFTVVKSLEYAFLMNIAALLGGIGASFVQDSRLGRKSSIIFFFFLSGIASYLFSISHTDSGILAAGATLSFLLNGLFSMLYTFTPEQYASWNRSTGQGFASGVGHIGGVIGPLLIGVVLSAIGMAGIFGLFAVFLLVPIVAVLFLRETRAQPVERT